MNSMARNRAQKRFFALSMPVVLAGAMSLPALAQSNKKMNTSGNIPSAEKSATGGLSSLPASAQSPISSALGKDDSGYWIHPTANGLRGDNPQQALVTDFTKQGPEVRSHNLRWGLRTRAYGYGNALRPLKAVAPQASANRVEYRRDGLTEWYENGPLGLEQGFTLAHRPGKTNGQPLTLELSIRGDLTTAVVAELARLDKKTKALELRGRDGKAALRYAGLKTTDAAGRELRSWLEVRGKRLLVRVEDGEAQYPVVVDPWVQQAELTASDGASGDEFGWSVAVGGTTAVVGAHNHKVGSNQDQGAAYVFTQSGTTWSQQAELTSSDGAALDYFGESVAISGGTVVVGASDHKVGSNQQQGAAYVFVVSGGTWSQQAELTSSDGAYQDFFGSSVSVSGSTVVVGAYGHEVGTTYQQGAAYVFVVSGGTWSQQAELTASDGAYGDRFGYSVALSSSTALVGAYNHTVGSNSDQGAVYVFVQSGTTWSQQAELTSSDGAAGDAFGDSVAVDSSTAVVGAFGHEVGSNLGQGAAYVFVQSGTTWSQQAELTSSDGGAYDGFGSSVALSGSVAAVGAYQHSVGSTDEGAAYVFGQSGGTWTQLAELTVSGGATYDFFGWSVSVVGSTALVGDPRHVAGAAYVFHRQ